ncbi:hypothetical protein Bbelb_064480 [Branchiostoma belcheri]|nr:hypothetical protein Bbelb_064480 [Branchiostoma belcheri]
MPKRGVRDNRGTEFLLTFLENFQRQGHQPALFISTQSQTATVTITLPSTGQTTTVTATNGQASLCLISTDAVMEPIVQVTLRKYDVSNGSKVVTEVDLNRVAVELRGSRKSDKAIHVTSDEEIVIYGVFAEWATSDAYLALPTDVLGTEYFVACMTVRRAWSEEGWYNLPTEIGIVGVYDGTTITINPTQDLTFGGTNYPAGQDFTVSLDRFQTLQVQSTEDLTGSRITSSHPVSVLSGNLFTVIGNNQQGSGDHIVEMMPPVDTWGKEFVTAPIAKRTAGDIFRVVAARDNTEVTVTGRNPRNLDAGQFWEFEAGSNEYLHVTSNEPVLLVQYSKTAAADNTDTDPFSMIIPPVAQFEADYTFSTVELLYNGGAGTTHHVNLVIQSADKSGIIFDGQPLPGSTVWHPVPGTTYEATDLTISAGTHTATHSSPIATFGLFRIQPHKFHDPGQVITGYRASGRDVGNRTGFPIYGLTNLEAYGYPGGLRLAQIGGACTPTQTVANDRVDNDCDGRVDEELRNGIDDDGDGLIDEDIASGGTDVGRRPIFKISTIYPSLPQEREICYAWGDPHTCTPDGRVYHFQGPCRYTFAKDCLNGDFTVEVQQVPSHWRPTVSLVREVYVMAYGYTITIKQGRVVTVDPQPPPSPATLPFSLAGGNIVVRLSGRFVRVELTALCVVIFYDGSHHIKAEIPSNYKSNLCGLCGNYNGIASDDYLMPDGTLALNWNDFGNSWEVTSESCQGDRPTGEPPTQGPCDPVLSDQCNVLTDTNGPFAECHGFVDPGTYWGTCVFDICETEGAIFCENLETYYDACLAAGGTPFDWRTPTNCPMDCPANSAYSPCTTACPASCPDPNPTCTEACVEGCVCNDGFILSGLECVPLADCGCIDENGFYHVLGAQWGTPDGRRCECTVGGNIECEQVSCDEAAGYSWTLVDGVWGCNCVDSCCEKEICYAWGDPHTCTPDGRVYHFQGPCRYTFAKDCLNGDFNVEVQQVPSHWRPTVSLVREVYVMAYGYTITIKQGRVVTVDPPPPPSPATLPFSLAGGNIVVRLSGRFVRVELTALCVVIFYDGSHHIKAEIPSNYKSNLCGLCGNYNGIASDDYLMPDGTLALNWNDFGNSWEVTSESCQGDRPTGEPPTQGPCDPVLSDQCNVLTDTNGPFAECHGFVDPGTYWGTCVFDICETEGAIFCENLETYYDACLAAGGTPFDWRTPTNCPMDCPANSAYSPCTTACPASCPDPNPTCTEACVEGCVCNDGFILSGLECVPLVDCGCIDENGFYHALGAQWGTPDGRRCECTVGGNIECEQVSCDEAAGYSWTLVDGVWGCNCVDSCCEKEICYAWGDPHTCTPDGRVYHFQGPCRYTFAKDCLNGDFTVEVQQVPSHWRPTVSLVREVYVMAYGYTITIKQGRVVTVDPPPPPSPATLPFSLAGGNIVVRLSGRFVRIELTALCVVIFYDGSHHIKAEIPSNYKSNLCGLCGNYNGIASDDYLMPDGTLALNWNDFGNSWEVTSESCQGDRPTGEPPTQGPCDPVFSDQCNVLTDTNGPFAECHGFVDPGTYWGTCVFDICETEGAIFCENLETYYDACLAAGGTPFDWRTPTNCPMDCPANSAYSPCTTACPASCADPNPTCTEACVEGCVCNDGFILSGLECVPLADCGCIDENGFYHALGAQWGTPDGRRCECTVGGNIECEQVSCDEAAGYSWTLVDGVWGCNCVDSCCEREICYAWGDPHTCTPDGRVYHFQGPCRYTFAKDCLNGDFNVEVQQVPSHWRPTVSLVREVYVMAYGYTITIKQGRVVTVDPPPPPSPATLPFSLAGGNIVVRLSGRFVRVELTALCVVILYDGSHHIKAEIPSNYKSNLCGLCGNYNGIASDDYLMPDGTLALNWNDFGNSWEVTSESCQGDRPTGEPPTQGPCDPVFSDQCNVLTDTNGPFAECHGFVDPGTYWGTCVFDICETEGAIFCENLETYYDACLAAGGTPFDWRTPTNCPMDCPANSAYSPCTTACPASCPDPNPTCTEACVEGCVCNDGFILSGLECVPLADCGCIDENGFYHALGDEWRDDGMKCTCTADGIVCERRGICTACGDPHFSTFDGLRHHFQGPCRYTFAKDCGESNDFTVEVQHVPVPSRPVVSVVREVFVLAYGYEVGIHQRRTVTVNGAPRTVSFSLAGGRIRVSLSGRRVHVQLVEFCVDIYYDGSHCVEVKVTPYYLDRMCGLCGNYNGNKGDDYMMSDLITIASNWNDFGFSWLVEDEDENSCEGGGKGPRPCPEGLMTLVSNNGNCGLITDTSGPFAACHTAVPPADFFEDCTFDMCARGGDIVGLCENLEHYVLACEGQGVSITWRTPTLCPLSCPPNSHYNPCTSPCPPTCQDPNPVCAEVCVESCECDDGYIMSGLHCVLPEDCGCTDPVTGRYYELGETWIEDGERCVCKEDNTIECKECVFDIVFLLDRSSSIGPYGMFNAKKFITSIIECLKDLDVDVGYICFECITKWLVKQGLYDVNDPAIIQQIKDAEYTGGEGRTGHALQHLIQTAEYRKNVSSVAVVLSDGDVHDQGNKHEINSDAARAEGIDLYSVPVGREALFNFGVLQYIAGAPDRVFDQFSTCDLAIKIMQDVCVIEEELASPDEYLP